MKGNSQLNQIISKLNGYLSPLSEHRGASLEQEGKAVTEGNLWKQRAWIYWFPSPATYIWWRKFLEVFGCWETPLILLESKPTRRPFVNLQQSKALCIFRYEIWWRYRWLWMDRVDSVWDSSLVTPSYCLSVKPSPVFLPIHCSRGHSMTLSFQAWLPSDSTGQTSKSH